MHEWALAEAVVRACARVAEEKRADRVVSVVVKLGELQQIDEEAFSYALSELSRGTVLEGARFVLEREEAKLRCRSCGHEWPFSDALALLSHDEREAVHFVPELVHAFVKCPRCGSPDFDIEGGRGVWVECVEIERR